MAQPRNPPPRERGDSTLLAGRYRYEGELGRGASGRVLALTDRGGAARVAKLLDAHAGARAQWELDALLAVESPHLVRAVELLRVVDALPAPFSIPRGGWVLVETRAPGERSDRVLAELTDLERRAERIADAARGVARGLAALHAHGLSHGDVKPENVLLEGTHATLIDLGAAAPFGRLESVSGTLAFLAPEAREGERSVATDLYALGATLLAWATGIEPHPEQPLPSWLPTPLASLVRALLDERVADRPRDAAAVLTALGEPPRAAGALASFAPPRPVGIGDAIDKLVRLLDEHGWAVIVGPDGSGRSRLAEEGARALQRREARAGHEVPTLVRTSDAPVAPEASSVIVLEGTPPTLAEVRRLLAEGRIVGARHRIVMQARDLSGLEGAPSVRTHALDPTEARELLTALLGEQPTQAVLGAALDATGGLAGRLVRGVSRLRRGGIDPARPEHWRLVASADEEPLVPKAAERVAAIASALGGEITLESGLEDASLADGARWLAREGLAALRDDGTLVVHARGRSLFSEAQRARALREASRLPLRGLSRAVLEAHGAEHAAADAAALAIARVARDEGRPEEAARVLSRYLERVPARSDASRAEVHLARADAVRASGDVAGARVLLETTAPGDDVAVRLLHAELVRLSGEARGACEEGLALEGTAASDDARALVARAELSRDPARAEALSRALLDGAPPSAAARGCETLALVALSRGAASEVIAMARRGLREADRLEPLAARATARARLLSLEGQGLALGGQLAEARARHGESARVAAQAGDRLLEATFGANDGLAALDHGEIGPALVALEHAARLFLRLDRPRELVRVLANLANARGLAGDDVHARSVIDEAERALASSPDADARGLVGIVRSELLLVRGKLRAATAALESVRDPATLTGRIALCRLAAARAASGELAAAEAALAALGHVRGDDPRVVLEHALARTRVALAALDPHGARAALDEAASILDHGHVGFELRTRTLALEVEVAEALGRRADARAALGRLRAALEPALRSLPPLLQARFRQLPMHRRALAEGVSAGTASDAPIEVVLDGLAALAREPRVEALDERLADLALEVAAAERAFVVEWTEQGPEVRARAGAARGDPSARPSSSLVARALREGLVVSTDALHESDASSSVHALALRSVLAVELAPRPVGKRPRVLVVDDPLRAGAFDGSVVRAMRALAEIAAPLIAARRDARRARARERKAERRELSLEADVRRREDLVDAPLDPFASIVHADPATARSIEEARRLASSDLPLLLVGETGVGKDLLARAIHRASPRRHEPFVAERGAALGGPLADATIFGHARGAFTGAEAARKGLFELAHGGTLYLDGIEDLTLETQARLLRILVEGEVRPLGASRARRIDVRIVAAMRTSPAEALAAGTLREDFYYRVAGAVLAVPPLRDRPRDLDALIDHLLARSGRDLRLTTRAREALHARRWPGNVRELEHTLADALVRAEGTVLDLSSLAPSAIAPDPPTGAPTHSLHERRGALTRELVLATLEAHGGNRTHAARALGISRFGLQKMLRRLAAHPGEGAQRPK